jgi:hypothetical protein
VYDACRYDDLCDVGVSMYITMDHVMLCDDGILWGKGEASRCCFLFFTRRLVFSP